MGRTGKFAEDVPEYFGTSATEHVATKFIEQEQVSLERKQAKVWFFYCSLPAGKQTTMPPAKRVKSGAGSRSQAAPVRPTPSDSEGNSEFASLAKQHWLKSSKRSTRVKVKNDVLKHEIWDALEKEGFPFKSLLTLESLQALERYEFSF